MCTCRLWPAVFDCGCHGTHYNIAMLFQLTRGGCQLPPTYSFVPSSSLVFGCGITEGERVGDQNWRQGRLGATLVDTSRY